MHVKKCVNVHLCKPHTPVCMHKSLFNKLWQSKHMLRRYLQNGTDLHSTLIFKEYPYFHSYVQTKPQNINLLKGFGKVWK